MKEEYIRVLWQVGRSTSMTPDLDVFRCSGEYLFGRHDLCFWFSLLNLLDFDAGDDTKMRRNRNVGLAISCLRQ
jgi:hypothetical protein